MSETPILNAPVYPHGYVTGRYLTAVADGPDDDHLMDFTPAKGKVIFTPETVIRRHEGPSPALVVQRPVECPINSQGYLTSPDGWRGVYLIVGIYSVRFEVQGAQVPGPKRIEVKETHTPDAPLDLVLSMPEVVPPGSVVVVNETTAQRAEAAAARAEAVVTNLESEVRAVVLASPELKGKKGDKGDKGDPGAPGALANASSYILVGPGRPDRPATTNGVITGKEPVGAEYRSTDGAGEDLFDWMKRPTGWELAGGVGGSVPIFATLAEAAAWEAKNPGKTALTLEPSTPDTTAPTPGVLSVTPAHNSAVLSVSGATDDRAVTGYAFQVGASGAWSVWQSSPSFTATGLTASTSYAFRHKVRDRAGNEALGSAVTATTAAKPPVQAGDVMTSDAYTLYADGSLVNGKFTDATLGGEPQAYTVAVNADGAVYQGGALSWAKRAIVALPLTREDKEVSFTVKALSTTGDKFYLTLRLAGSNGTRFIFGSNGSVTTLLQGPAGNISGPNLPAGTVKAGSQITFGVKGDTGYFIIDGVRTDIPSLQGNTGGVLHIDNGAGGAIDNLVVKAL